MFEIKTIRFIFVAAEMSLAGSPIDERVYKSAWLMMPSIDDASRNSDEIGKEKKEAGKKDESRDRAQLAGQLAP